MAEAYGPDSDPCDPIGYPTGIGIPLYLDDLLDVEITAGESGDYPDVAQSATFSDDTATTDHVIDYPEAMVPGNRLFMFLGFQTGVLEPEIYLPSGWDMIGSPAQNYDHISALAEHLITGTEGETFTVETQVALEMAGVLVELENAGPAQGGSGFTYGPLPEQANSGPVGMTTGTKFLVLSCMVTTDTGASLHLDAYPSGYSGVNERSGGATPVFVGVAWKQTLTDDENPGEWTMDDYGISYYWGAWSIGYAGPGGITDGSLIVYDLASELWINQTAAEAGLAAAAHSHDLADLGDVNVGTPDDGDVLTWDADPGEWIAVPSAGGASVLDDLTDVNAPAPDEGDVLTWDDDPGEWIAAPAPPPGAHDHDADYVDVAGDLMTGSLMLSAVFPSLGFGTDTDTGMNQLFGDDTWGLAIDFVQTPPFSGTEYLWTEGYFAPVNLAFLSEGASVVACDLGLATFAPWQNVIATTLCDEAGNAKWDLSVDMADAHDHDADYADIAHEHALDDLSDVAAASPDDGDVLTWVDGSPGSWQSVAPSGGATGLDDLSDVNTAAPTAGQVLTWDDSEEEWIADDPPAAGPHDLESHTDVTYGVIEALTADDILVCVDLGGETPDLQWVNVPSESFADYVASMVTMYLDDLMDVDAAAPDDGDVLTWDSVGEAWIPAPAGAGGGSIDDLSDVTLGTPTHGDVLWYDTDHWEDASLAEAGIAAAAHDHDGDYLAIGGKAADSDLLDSHDTAYFAVADHDHDGDYLPLAGGTLAGQLLWDGGSAAAPGLAVAQDIDCGLYYAATLVGVSIGGVGQVTFQDGSVLPVTDNDINLGSAALSFKDVFAYHYYDDGGNPALYHLFALSYPGTVATCTDSGAPRLMIPWAHTIIGCRATLGTANTGASLIADVHKDGTTIYTTQGNRPTIAATNQDSGSWSAPDVTAFAANSIYTLNVDQVGSTIAGADLIVHVWVKRLA